MKKRITFLILFILIIFPTVLALTAESDNYSVSRFGEGIQTSSIESVNFTGKSIFLEVPGTNNAQSENYTINVGFFENPYKQTVNITSYSISPSSTVVGSTVGLYIAASNFKNVWAKITSPNNQEQIINLINNQTVNYLPSPSIVGKYRVTFYANSSTGAITSVIDYFDLTAQAATTTTTGEGGGGGTKTIIETCSYDWDCTSWNVCSEGKQIRQCRNIGTCNGTDSKPIEEMHCSEALFDVTMKFKSIEFTKNETLKFGVELTEIKGIEKIDVQIKYSIIDDNNTEIFSQIETRAIQKNLTFEKEINETRLKEGKYILRIDIVYGNQQKAFAEQSFKIETKEGKPSLKIVFNINNALQKLKDNLLLILIILLLVMIFLLRNKIKKLFTSTKKKQGRRYMRIRPKQEIRQPVRRYMHIRPKSKQEIRQPAKKQTASLQNAGDTIKSLMDKKVYAQNGHYIGKVNEVILGSHKIEELKVDVDKENPSATNSLTIKYSNIKKINETIVVDNKILNELI